MSLSLIHILRGTEGAMEKVWLENGKLSWHVIGEGEPKGICGSGLLDATACLLRLGKLDETGRMEEQTVSFTEQVYLNQRDIRELQLAKAAICAGIRLLCSHRGIKVDEIDTLLIEMCIRDSYYADLEKEMLEKINELGIGPQGFGGKTTALALNIETMPTHIAGMPCAVNINCHVTRHKTEVI